MFRGGILATVLLVSGCSSSSGGDWCTASPQGNVCVLDKSACCGCYGNPPCDEALGSLGDAGAVGPGTDATVGPSDATVAGDATHKDAQPDAGDDDASAADACTLYHHADGFGRGWFDCVPLGTYSQAEAEAACAAYIAMTDGGWTCGNPGGPICGTNTAWGATTQTAAPNIYWVYQGPDQGVVMNGNCAQLGQWY